MEANEPKPEKNMENKTKTVPPRLWKEGDVEEKEYQEWRKQKLHTRSKHI